MGDAEVRRASGLQSIVVYGPLVVGVVLLVLHRVVPDLRGGDVLASALLLMALSCFIYAAMPTSGEITDQQRVLLGQIGVDYRASMGRLANGVIGLLLSVGALWAFIFVV
jgi:hypothetical protein